MRRILFGLMAFILFLTALFLADQYNKHHNHPTLTKDARLPDEYLIDAVISNQQDDKTKCLIYLERAIQALWVLEKDMNEEGAAILEEAIFKLEELHKKITLGTIQKAEVKEIYSDVIYMLAASELSVAKNLAKNGDFPNTKIALDYTLVHLKNATLFGNETEEGKLLEDTAKRIEKLKTNDSDNATGNVVALQCARIIEDMKRLWK